MQNISFLKEALGNTDKKTLLIILNQKQFKSSLFFALNSILLRENESVILVSLTQSGTSALESVGTELGKNMVVVDAFSKEDKDFGRENILYVGSTANLTKIQIAIERAISMLPGKKTIIFDSLGFLAMYNTTQIMGRFIHLFTNKISLEGHSCIFLAVKESTNEDDVENTRKFCDKTYDYSNVFISTIELV